ncbi:MAG TPA: hypothetical protein VD815_02690 [Candidatus Saccharimonadales bacterium]|nr:hypothetical protein [Candidatus Saccharimonadales bacterium]
MSIKYQFEEIAGKVCKFLYPIPTSFYRGCGKSIAICTLSSMSLLKKISQDQIMEKVLIAGRLFSENKGIDAVITFCTTSSTIRYLIICGKDTKGHQPGDALVNLMANGIDKNGVIINAVAPYPKLNCNPAMIENFRNIVKLIDLRGCSDLQEIRNEIDKIT